MRLFRREVAQTPTSVRWCTLSLPARNQSRPAKVVDLARKWERGTVDREADLTTARGIAKASQLFATYGFSRAHEELLRFCQLRSMEVTPEMRLNQLRSTWTTGLEGIASALEELQQAKCVPDQVAFDTAADQVSLFRLREMSTAAVQGSAEEMRARSRLMLGTTLALSKFPVGSPRLTAESYRERGAETGLPTIKHFKEKQTFDLMKEESDPALCLRIFFRARSRGELMSLPSFELALSRLVGLKRIHKAEALVEEARADGLNLSPASCYILIKYFIDNHRSESARAILEKLGGQSGHADEATDISATSLVVQEKVKAGNLTAAGSWLQKLRTLCPKMSAELDERAARHVSDAYGALIRAHISNGDLNSAQQIFNDADRYRLRSFDLMLARLLLAVMRNELELVEKYRQKLKPYSPERVDVTLLEADILRGQAKDWEHVLRTLRSTSAEKMGDSMQIVTALVKTGRLNDAVQLIQQLDIGDKGQAFNIVMTACENDRKTAQELFRAMLASGIQPSLESYGSLVQAFINDDDLEPAVMALQYLRHQAKVEFKPDGSTVRPILDYLGAGSELASRASTAITKDLETPVAAAIVKALVGAGDTVTAYKVCNILLDDACWLELVRADPQYIEDMQEDGAKPDTSTWKAAIEGFARRNDTVKTVRTIERMTQSGQIYDVRNFPQLIHDAKASGHAKLENALKDLYKQRVMLSAQRVAR
mmetsp:Transcript_8200/g.24681  ORF Transcript_8200/g.24681 Transcript_8200/m.24681 type:complete len:714 (+) Transcript_8200:250-2391(+)|eukprot:CAMPEP_0198733734 /NCGR_PEP_ID=MMETSP1475-20131203/47951_1 /TAXON_ID= ORGANISM="Unidentified sp., Strain CCMP1999" /NCGR_SAMPLE_ID=MMETSP1475 /ASSEMBLY_ACC=CAM_ASM_001111 /LENGTH=713 /DNA_ID=CAMNT_0044497083 /DNA_START=165 /DNA_END=2306 /DNA_ORIENTATION=-